MDKSLKTRLILQSVLLLFVLTIGSQIVFSQDRERSAKQTWLDNNMCQSIYYAPLKRSCLKKLEGQFSKKCPETCLDEIETIHKKYKETTMIPFRMFLTFLGLIGLGLWYSGIVRLPSIARGKLNTMIIREVESSAATVLIIKTLFVIIIIFVYTQVLKSSLWPK